MRHMWSRWMRRAMPRSAPMTTLRDRIKAALDLEKTFPYHAGMAARELLPLVLAELERLEAEVEANESSAQNLLRAQRDALHKDLVRVTAERDEARDILAECRPERERIAALIAEFQTVTTERDELRLALRATRRGIKRK
jgi:DNA-binding protein Fis